MPHSAADLMETLAMKFPLLGKTLAVGGVLLALTMALHSISAIVSEREGRLHEADGEGLA